MLDLWLNLRAGGSHCFFPAHRCICSGAAKLNAKAIFNAVRVKPSKLKVMGSLCVQADLDICRGINKDLHT